MPHEYYENKRIRQAINEYLKGTTFTIQPLHCISNASLVQASSAAISTRDKSSRVLAQDADAAATALNHFAYNFIKIHRTLRPSPAMAAGVTHQQTQLPFGDL